MFRITLEMEDNYGEYYKRVDECSTKEKMVEIHSSMVENDSCRIIGKFSFDYYKFTNDFHTNYLVKYDICQYLVKVLNDKDNGKRKFNITIENIED